MKKSVALIGALLPLAALAGDPAMKPGLYDYTIKMEMPGMPFAMPPQKVQNCVKQEDLAEGKQYQAQPGQECEFKNMKQSPGKVSFDVACKDGSTGRSEYAFTENSMDGKQVFTNGGTSMTTSVSARRVGDCKK